MHATGLFATGGCTSPAYARDITVRVDLRDHLVILAHMSLRVDPRTHTVVILTVLVGSAVNLIVTAESLTSV